MHAPASKNKEANLGFQFKQFFVRHDACAMKVGTDGVLLGAWAPTAESRIRILDAGTGSGLIALMLAQRCPKAQIDAVDIDAEACAQAADNFAASPWADRLHAIHCPLQQLANSIAQTLNPSNRKAVYNIIVSNPPYFVDSLKNPDAARRTARHNDTLPFNELIGTCAHLLAPNGTLAIIVPAEAEQYLQDLAAEAGLRCYRRCHVHPKPGRPAKRVMVAWHKTEYLPVASVTMQNEQDTHLTLENEQGGRSEAYQQLAREFYL